MNATEIQELWLNISVRGVRKVLYKTPALKFWKENKALYFLRRNKDESFEWAHEMFQWKAIYWESFLFTDVKRFNLDESNLLACYLNDLITYGEIFLNGSKGEIWWWGGGGGVKLALMVWFVWKEWK